MTDAPVAVPQHVAIIMDGNGRWAEQRNLPRHAGHRAGRDSVRRIVEESLSLGVQVLTLFAFSSENWRRPPAEISVLMELFVTGLQREIKRLRANDVRLRVIGDITAFPKKLQDRIVTAEEQTASNRALKLQIAANYGGRWDIVQAVRLLAAKVRDGDLALDSIDETLVCAHMSMADVPDPDLFIRSGGEQRISNFMLWQCAYTELYFTDTLWPDFDELAYRAAIDSFSRRQRRYGRTSEQVDQNGES